MSKFKCTVKTPSMLFVGNGRPNMQENEIQDIDDVRQTLPHIKASIERGDLIRVGSPKAEEKEVIKDEPEVAVKEDIKDALPEVEEKITETFDVHPVEHSLSSEDFAKENDIPAIVNTAEDAKPAKPKKARKARKKKADSGE